MTRIAWLVGFEGRIGRGAYLRWGLGLGAAKFLLDWAWCTFVIGTAWSPLLYVLAWPLPIEASRWQWLVLAALSVPFCWLGVALTVRRLRDAGNHPWLCALFAVPCVNLVMFAIAASLPTELERRAQRAMKRPPTWLEQGPAPAFVALLATVLQVLLAVLVLEEYGGVLFLGVPFVQGFVIGALARRRPATAVFSLLLLSGGCTLLLLLLLGVEGIACIVMATPLVLALGGIGLLAGRIMQPLVWRRAAGALLVLPVAQFAEPALAPPPLVHEVTTEVLVRASPQATWDQLVAFGEMAPPTELVFRAGIAYPIRATIEGRGPGAIRYCTFNTGDFVEPIEVWDEPRRLAFSVLQCPQPMIEWNPFHDHVDAAHLHGFFAAVRGQFEIEPLGDGTTRLRGTTWYRHGLQPEAYWRQWGDAIVHAVHRRVLEHIRFRAETR
jgi:uncharacterized membrane protein YhaH (DUF805 family)